MSDNDDPVGKANARRAAKRAPALEKMVMDVLVHRVKDASGPTILSIGWDEYEKGIRQDPAFEPLSKYLSNLICYADGTPRPRPLRALLENEVGIWRGRIVCLNNMPGDGNRSYTIFSQVPTGTKEQP